MDGRVEGAVKRRSGRGSFRSMIGLGCVLVSGSENDVTSILVRVNIFLMLSPIRS